jgi:hypothetical protein
MGGTIVITDGGAISMSARCGYVSSLLKKGEKLGFCTFMQPHPLYWLHQLLKGSLLGLAQAPTEPGQQGKPDIGVAAEATAQETAEFP